MQCSKAKEAVTKEWTELVSKKDGYEFDLVHGHYLFKLEIWNYDAQCKVAEANICNSDLPCGEK